MLLFPFAKINLGLNVTGRREDGYHEVDTVLFPVGLYDALEAVPAPDGKMRFAQSGLEIPGNGRPNLCLQALELLQDEVRASNIAPSKAVLPPLHIHLHKGIPAASGLGGGSSDTAHMLLLLDRLAGLNLSRELLESIARQLGSDCPFFLQKHPMRATARGDRLHPIDPDILSPHQLLLIVPPLTMDTATAYSRIRPEKPSEPLPSILSEPVSAWQGRLRNRFENLVFALHPEVKNINTALLKAGALYASMSGSGPSVYGIFEGRPPASRLREEFPRCSIYELTGDVSKIH